MENNIPAMQEKALLIINPVSGRKKIVRYIPSIVRTLMDGGWQVTLMVTSRGGEATDLVCRYGEEHQLICCTGGDGTLNEVLTGLIRAGLKRPLGYIPCGSTNDFAATHSLSTDIPTAALNIVSGRRQSYDVGLFGERCFSYVAAFGAFSWLSYTTDQNLKNYLGHTAYILDAIKDLYKIRAEHITLCADGVTYNGDYIFGAVCNSSSVAGTITLPSSVVNTSDGIFEVLLVHMPETIMELEAIVHGLLTQDYSSPLINFFQARDIDIINSPGLEWSLDGERSGDFEKVHIEPVKGFLELQG